MNHKMQRPLRNHEEQYQKLLKKKTFREKQLLKELTVCIAFYAKDWVKFTQPEFSINTDIWLFLLRIPTTWSTDIARSFMKHFMTYRKADKEFIENVPDLYYVLLLCEKRLLGRAITKNPFTKRMFCYDKTYEPSDECCGNLCANALKPWLLLDDCIYQRYLQLQKRIL